MHFKLTRKWFTPHTWASHCLHTAFNNNHKQISLGRWPFVCTTSIIMANDLIEHSKLYQLRYFESLERQIVSLTAKLQVWSVCLTVISLSLQAGRYTCTCHLYAVQWCDIVSSTTTFTAGLDTIHPPIECRWPLLTAQSPPVSQFAFCCLRSHTIVQLLLTCYFHIHVLCYPIWGLFFLLGVHFIHRNIYY